MNARICLAVLSMVALRAVGSSGQAARPEEQIPVRLAIDLETATTADDGRPSSLRVAVKNVGTVTVWMPVLGQECTYVHVRWAGMLEEFACGMSDTATLTGEGITRSWVQMRPGEFMSYTVAVSPPTDDRRREFWVVYEPPSATTEEATRLLQSGYAIPTERVESAHQTYALR